jgi:hypothetical protein
MTRQPRDIDVEPVRVSPSSPAEARLRQSGLVGCVAATCGSPILGYVAYRATDDWRVGVAGAALAFIAALAWSARQMARGSVGGAGPMTWSFTPLGAAVVAATDVLATGGDFLPVTYVLLVVPCAFLGGGVVFLSEMHESRRALYSLAKAVAAVLLILVPMPVGGLVGAGASLGHRMILRRDVVRDPRGRGEPPRRA